MFQKGITMAEIADLIEKMYGHHYTPQTISNMTKADSGTVDAFDNARCYNRYVCVYLDATYIAVRRDTVSKEAVYFAVGIREDGSKEVLSYAIAPTESAYWNVNTKLNILNKGVILHILNFSFKVLPKDVVA